MSLTVLIILLPMPCRLQFIFLLLLVGCLVVWASTKFLFLFSYPRVHVISHSFQIYCFTENIEAKNILCHPSFCYLLCIQCCWNYAISTSCHLHFLSSSNHCSSETVNYYQIFFFPEIHVCSEHCHPLPSLVFSFSYWMHYISDYFCFLWPMTGSLCMNMTRSLCIFHLSPSRFNMMATIRLPLGDWFGSARCGRYVGY